MIWGMKIPRVVKTFLWKALNNNGLPTKENLLKRKVIDDPGVISASGKLRLFVMLSGAIQLLLMSRQRS